MALDAGTETFFHIAMMEPTLTDRPGRFLGTSDCEVTNYGFSSYGKARIFRYILGQPIKRTCSASNSRIYIMANRLLLTHGSSDSVEFKLITR